MTGERPGKQIREKFTKTEFEIMKDYEIEPALKIRKANKKIGISLWKRINLIIEEQQVLYNEYRNFELEIIISEI